VSVILFLFYGALKRLRGRVRAGNVDERRRWGRRSRHHADADGHLVGGTQVLAALRHDNPKLDPLLVSSMVGMCSQMMAFAIASAPLAP